MDNQKGECSRYIGERETDREIKKIRELIASIYTNSEVNKANLENVTEAYKKLAQDNNVTHYELFTRMERLKVDLGKLDTKHAEHVKHGTQENTNKHDRYTVLTSWVAIGISIITFVFLVVQAGVFKKHGS